MNKKVNIIGAGLAGLSAGIFLQQEGFETEIFELAGWAGGVCTAWVRNGYRFDGCIHWMVGTKKGDGFNQIYREVGALEEDTVIYSADSVRLEIRGVMYEVPMEISKFRAFLLTLSEQDDEKILGFCKDVELMTQTKMPAGAPSGLSEMIGLMKDSKGFLTLARKYLGKTIGEVAQSFHSEKIRELLGALMPADYSAEGIIMMLGTRMSGNAGYPMGGAQGVIRRMESKYRSLGGKINFNSRVDEIAVQDGAATAIRSRGVLYPADAVIAACDAYDTLQNMLKGSYVHPQLNNMLKTAPLFPTLALVCFGLKKQFSIPYSVRYECPEGIPTAPGVIRHSFSIRSFEFDPETAPENCSSVMITLNAPLEYWEKLRADDPDEYKRQKQQLADAVAGAVERRIPGFREAIAVTDVATPATYVRLANLYQGSFEGFAPTPSALKTNIKKRIPGLKKFCICGQWTSAGGGICSAISDGKRAANLVSKEIKK
ncbi:MAG: NAD(P)/FAD-dependent oxidoreductase [Clostridia bacterium]|nr:NAD(P)/FAD-dependent oxidoreductase [Clostridia bacterium]